ncbi:MAG: hypothetical protein KGY74_07110 [Candidatus Cloacimonetes bacterium]|nr:hypothetical protein [Candidatus Cloacimonadota bacterium]
MKISRKQENKMIKDIISTLKEIKFPAGISCKIKKNGPLSYSPSDFPEYNAKSYVYDGLRHDSSKGHVYDLNLLFKFKDDMYDSRQSMRRKFIDRYSMNNTLRKRIYNVLQNYNPVYKSFFNIFIQYYEDITISINIPDEIPLFRINEFLQVGLIGKSTKIYVNNQRFTQCSYLLFNLDANNLEKYNEINSIDEMKDKYSQEHEQGKCNLDPETEFWGHCSNLQAWAENDYDTRILEMRLAFPLLKRLTEVGDPMAKKVLKEEIARRYKSGYDSVQKFLELEGYLELLSLEEKKTIIAANLEKTIYSDIL